MTAVLPPILLIGGGKMGGAMLAGWRERGLSDTVVVDPAPGAATMAGGKVTVVPAASAIPQGFTPEAVVIAVKPQSAADAVPPAAPRFGDAVVLSIMAGVTTAGLHRMLGAERRLVRAMPNTPAAVRSGITVAYPAPGVTEAQRALCHGMLEAIGEVAWIEDESLMDAVTAVSGSGPAYVFLLAELMEKAAIEQGLPPALARQLARVTVTGSGALLAASPQDAADLRIAVTSPGGTTQAALEVLMPAWPETLSRAIASATARSRVLGQG